MSSECWCGIDVGTQGVRVSLVDTEGRFVAGGSRPLSSSAREAGRHEQSPADWWSALTGATREALDAAGADVRVLGLALDATSGTVLVESRDGSATGPALMYDDSRATDQLGRVQEVGADLWDALGYRMQPTWALPKVLWLLDHAGLSDDDRVVHQADHLVGRLVGRPAATDTSHALKTGVDLRSATWPTDVLHELGVPAGLLPDVVLPGTVLGFVSDDASGQTGLPAGIPVRAGMTDGCAAQVAAGALRPGSWSSALGTTLVIKGATAELVRDPQGAVYCHRSPDGGWLPGGASSTGAGVLVASLPGRDLDELTRLVQGRGVPSGVTYPLAGEGERFPFVAPEARGFVAPEVEDDADLFAALCVGVAYIERLAYDVLAGLGADVTGPVAMTGGGARNPWWNQVRADVLGRPGRVPASADSATGMAILASAEPGDLAETAERMVQIRDTYEPDPSRGEALMPGYHRLVTDLAERGWLDRDVADGVLSLPGQGVAR